MSAREIEKLDQLAEWLDSRYRIPGTSIRFGWDPIISVIPVLGDFAVLGPSVYLILKAHRLGVPKLSILRMMFNAALDTFVGSIPIAGSIFDLFFKANLKNIEILKKELSLRSDFDPKDASQAIR